VRTVVTLGGGAKRGAVIGVDRSGTGPGTLVSEPRAGECGGGRRVAECSGSKGVKVVGSGGRLLAGGWRVACRNTRGAGVMICCVGL